MRSLKRGLRNDATSRLNRLMKDVETKFRLKKTLVGDTGDLRREMLEEFLVRASEYSEAQVCAWLESNGYKLNRPPQSEVKGLGKVHGNRRMNEDGTWDRYVPGTGWVRFGEPRRIH